MFDPSIGYYNQETAQFDYHIQIEDLFEAPSYPRTKIAMFFGLKAYMIITDKNCAGKKNSTHGAICNCGFKLKCKGHKLASHSELCTCGKYIKWFCPDCLDRLAGKPIKVYCDIQSCEIDVDGVTLQHFYNCIIGQGNNPKFEYLRFEKQLNRPNSKGKKPFSIKSKKICISLNFKELSHKYQVKGNICYPFTEFVKL